MKPHYRIAEIDNKDLLEKFIFIAKTRECFKSAELIRTYKWFSLIDGWTYRATFRDGQKILDTDIPESMIDIIYINTTDEVKQ